MAKDIAHLSALQSKLSHLVSEITMLRRSTVALSEEELVNLADAENSLLGVYDSLDLVVNPPKKQKSSTKGK